jgi:hypothetical protein
VCPLLRCQFTEQQIFNIILGRAQILKGECPGFVPKCKIFLSSSGFWKFYSALNDGYEFSKTLNSHKILISIMISGYNAFLLRGQQSNKLTTEATVFPNNQNRGNISRSQNSNCSFQAELSNRQHGPNTSATPEAHHATRSQRRQRPRGFCFKALTTACDFADWPRFASRRSHARPED